MHNNAELQRIAKRDKKAFLSDLFKKIGDTKGTFHAKMGTLGISNFLQEISSLSHSVVFLYFFALITEEGFLISP